MSFGFEGSGGEAEYTKIRWEVLAEVGVRRNGLFFAGGITGRVVEVPLVAVPDGVRAKVVSLSNASMLAMITIPQTMDAKSKLENSRAGA